jgi:predicted methyltransferase
MLCRSGQPMTHDATPPLITLNTCQELAEAREGGAGLVDVSLDLNRSTTRVTVEAIRWSYDGRSYPYPINCKERTIYYWHEGTFQSLSRYRGALVKLVPTPWGAPTFEIDGIKMLPSEAISPYADAQRKVKLIRPKGKIVLDCCGGLGYFAAWCLTEGASRILSFEKNPEVLWLRSKNPWSPAEDERLTLSHADISAAIQHLAPASVDAALHDPPRFSIAGELYAEAFYRQLARVLKPRGLLFHYTGSPQAVSRRRDLAGEVSIRLEACGFGVERVLDGVLAHRNGR